MKNSPFFKIYLVAIFYFVCGYSYDFQDYNLHKIRQPIRIKCADKLPDSFKFYRMTFSRSFQSIEDFLPAKQIVFNQSFSVVSSSAEFEKHFQFSSNAHFVSHEPDFYIDSASFNHSGRYYCVYETQTSNSSSKFLVKSQGFKFFEEETIVGNFDQKLSLKACSIDKTSNLTWTYGPKMANYVKIDVNKNLIVGLYDKRLFDEQFYCQDEQSKALISYKIECLDCSTLFRPPIVTPSILKAPAGSQVEFICEPAANSRKPERYEWFHQAETGSHKSVQTTNNSDLKTAQLLVLKNITLEQKGFYSCCSWYHYISKFELRSKVTESGDMLVHKYCNQAELEIYENTDDAKDDDFARLMRKIIGILACIVVFVLVGIALYFYFRLKRIKNTRNALESLKENKNSKNTAYKSHDEMQNLTDSFENLSALDDEELKQFREIVLNNNNNNNSSIDALLSEKEKKWFIPYDCIDFGKVIGRGAFGIVMQANLKSAINTTMSYTRPRTLTSVSLSHDADSGLDFSTNYYYQLNLSSANGVRTQSFETQSVPSVAIKKLPDNAAEKSHYDLYKELKLMFDVGNHPNIINLVGYSFEKKSFCIVTDYAKYGNLKDFLRSCQEKNAINAGNETLHSKMQAENAINLDHLLLYSYQIALGMEYLHSKKVLHRDLAARNILVDDYDLVKIADFGLARNMQPDYYYVQKSLGKVPFKWMSPEALRCNRISKESDIWSYGVLLWEIFTYGCVPYPSIQPDEILGKLASGYRMEKPADCAQHIYENVMMKCWEFEPKKRPHFSELVKEFKILLAKPEYVNVNSLMRNQTKQDKLAQLRNVSAHNASSSASSSSSSSTFLMRPLSSSSSPSWTENSNQTYLSIINSSNLNETNESVIKKRASRDSFKEAHKEENLFDFDSDLINNQQLATFSGKNMPKVLFKNLETDKLNTYNNPIYNSNRLIK